MNTKANLPSLDDDLATPRRVNLRAIQSPAQTDDATVDENSRKLGGQWGAHTSLAVSRPKTPLASLRIEVPEYLDRELALKAVEQRVTKQYLVVQALKNAGFHIDPADLVADKRKVKR
jgi:hypothetical protein